MTYTYQSTGELCSSTEDTEAPDSNLILVDFRASSRSPSEIFQICSISYQICQEVQPMAERIRSLGKEIVDLDT